MGWILMGVGAVIFIIVAVQTFNVFNNFGYGSFDNSELIGWVVMIVILIGVIVAVVAGSGTGQHKSTGLLGLFDPKEYPPPK